jgi:hypothetical protein
MGLSLDLAILNPNCSKARSRGVRWRANSSSVPVLANVSSCCQGKVNNKPKLTRASLTKADPNYASLKRAGLEFRVSIDYSLLVLHFFMLEQMV